MPSVTQRFLSGIILSAGLLGMSGCWNGDVSNVSLGNVSVGQQLLALQAAQEADALTDAEYEQARQKLLSLLDGCDCQPEDDDHGENDAEGES